MDTRELQMALEELIFVGQAHKLGLFGEVYRKPDTSDGIALRMGFDKRCTWTLMEALVEMGYLKRSNEIYSVHHEVYDRLVDEDGQQYEGSFWQFLLYLINPWRTLPSVLRSGKPVQSSYGDFSVSDFIKGMDAPWKKRIAPEIVDICLLHCNEATVVADIGGAPGTIAKVFAGRGVKTIIYDLPECMEVMRHELSDVPNIEIQTGDATKALPAGPYDIAFLGNLCHGQGPRHNARIIEMCYENLSEKGIIAIFDNIRGESYRGATLALHMITQSPEGNIYSREEYLRWLEDAGFRGVEIQDLSDNMWQLIIGHKAGT